jgi:hypothetical protein
MPSGAQTPPAPYVHHMGKDHHGPLQGQDPHEFLFWSPRQNIRPPELSLASKSPVLGRHIPFCYKRDALRKRRRRDW